MVVAGGHLLEQVRLIKLAEYVLIQAVVLFLIQAKELNLLINKEPFLVIAIKYKHL